MSAAPNSSHTPAFAGRVEFRKQFLTANWVTAFTHMGDEKSNITRYFELQLIFEFLHSALEGSKKTAFADTSVEC